MGQLTVVLGLGNPGPGYERTRHNLGFRVVDRLAADRGVRLRVDGELGRRVWSAETPAPDGSLVLAKPRTYMNRSGSAASALCRHYSVGPEQLLVVYDDADLELGRLRIREEGRAGGHRGVRSIIDALGTSGFPRIRLGVRGERRDAEELEDYVLEPFDPDEEPIAAALVGLAAEAVGALLAEGLAPAMNRYNSLRAQPSA